VNIILDALYRLQLNKSVPLDVDIRCLFSGEEVIFLQQNFVRIPHNEAKLEAERFGRQSK